MTVVLDEWPMTRRLPEFALWVEPVGRGGFFAVTTDGISPASRQLAAAEISEENAALRIDAPVNTGLHNIPWFHDSRLSMPGTYVLRLVIGESLSALYERVDAKLEEIPRIAVSEPITFTVVDPQGDDRAVWQKMLAISPTGWRMSRWISDGSAVAEFVWTEYPRSTYAPYVAYFRFRDHLNTLKMALEMFPGNEFEDEWRYFVAQRLYDQMTAAITARDRVRMEKLFVEARGELEKVVKKAKPNKRAKARADEELEVLESTAQRFRENASWWRQ
jgi:hypothetical protein